MARNHTIVGGAALVNSAAATVLSAGASALFTELGSPATTDVFFETWISVVKNASETGYADVYRVVGYLTTDGSTFTSASVQQIFHWDIPIATLAYSGYVTAVAVDVSGGNIRVRVTGSSTGSEAKATAWLTLGTV